MAYTTGVSASVADLLSAVRAFAVSNAGFTDHWASRWTFTSGVTYDMFQLSKNGVYYTFQYTASILNMSTATSLGTSGSLTGQPGADATFYSVVRPIQGPHVAYWLFNGGYAGTGPCVHVVVETSSGVFIHFSFGELEKQGVYTGGQYVTSCMASNNAAYWNDALNGYQAVPWAGRNSSPLGAGSIRYPNAGSSLCAPWGNVGGSRMAIGSWTTDYGSAGDGLGVTRYAYNTFNQRAPLIPIEVLITNTAYGSFAQWIPMGNVAGVAGVNTRYLDPRQVVLSDWQVFPIFEKQGTGVANVNGGYFGLAYKR